jgi:hypothetical protein
VRLERFRDRSHRGLAEDAVGSPRRLPVETAPFGVGSAGVDAGETEGGAVGHGDVPAIPVEQDRAVSHYVVELGCGWQSQLLDTFVVEPLTDDRALHPLAVGHHETHHLVEVDGVHQLEPIDQGGVSKGMEMMVVVHQWSSLRCSGMVLATMRRSSSWTLPLLATWARAPRRWLSPFSSV